MPKLSSYSPLSASGLLASGESFFPFAKVVGLVGTLSDYLCDSNTNDQSTTTQAIINSAISDVSSAGGGTVHLRAGTYYVKTPGISLPDNVTLQGEGFATVIKRSVGSEFPGTIHNTNNNATTGIGNVGITVRNLTIDGNYRGYVPSGTTLNNLTMAGCIRSLIDHVYIYDSPHAGIVLDYTDFPAYTHDTIVRNCVVDTSVDIGIYCSNPYSNSILGNIVNNTASYGIRVIRRTSGGAQYNLGVHNRLTNCGTNTTDGIVIDQADLTEVSSNQIVGAGKNGIQVVNAAYVNINGNFISQPQQNGILFTSASRSSVTGNVIYQASQQTTNTYSGISLSSTADTTVTGNRSGDSGSGTRQKYGVSEDGTSDNNVISSNMLDRNGTSGLNTVGASTITGLNRV